MIRPASHSSSTWHALKCALLISLSVCLFGQAVAEEKPGEIDFARQIRPLLAAKCLACHGADEKARKAGLRLDVRETATSELESGEVAIVPGKPGDSDIAAEF